MKKIPGRDDMIRRASAAYRSHSRKLGCDPLPVGPARCEVRDGLVTLRGPGGRFLCQCEWGGGRIVRLAVCVDCGVRLGGGDCFMVTGRVWESLAGYRADETACVCCLEGRLRRKVRLADFTDAPVNEHWRRIAADD